MNTITVDGIVTRIGKRNKEDLICVTDLARWENPARPDKVCKLPSDQTELRIHLEVREEIQPGVRPHLFEPVRG